MLDDDFFIYTYIIKNTHNADVPVVLESLRRVNHGRRHWDSLTLTTEEEYTHLFYIYVSIVNVMFNRTL